MSVIIEKSTIKEKYYSRVITTTKYNVLGKTYYAANKNIATIKKMLKAKGYTDIKIHDLGTTTIKI